MENSEIVIEGNQATYRMPTTTGDLGGTYTGTFVFRCFLDPMRQLMAGKEYRELLGQYGGLASVGEDQLAFALTQLKQRVIKAPPFWTSTAQESGISGNVGDINIISLVLEAAIAAEEMYKQRISNEREEVLSRAIKSGEEIIRKEKE